MRTHDAAGRLERLRNLLATAVTLPPEKRLPLVEQARAEDPDMAAELQALLAEHQQMGSFMEQPLPELLGAPRERPVLPAGTLLKDRYRTRAESPAGGSSSVYLANDELLQGKTVIIKILDFLGEQRSRELFAAELGSLVRIQHPNVVGVSDMGTLPGGVPFLVLGFVPGPTLRALLRKGPLPVQRAQSILEDIARGLSAAHQAGFAHLDVKPENIIVSDPDSKAPVATLLDFGASGNLADLPDSPALAGTLGYMAPEQHEDPSGRSDVFALSVVGFEMLTGRPPAPGADPLRELPWDTPPLLARAIERGLRGRPEERFASAGAFLESLHASSRTSRISYWVAAAVAVVALVAVFWAGAPRPGPVPSKARRVTQTPSQETTPGLSPHGDLLVYAQGVYEKRDIYMMRLPNGAPELVAGTPYVERWPEVTPDGRSVIFLRDRDRMTDFVRREIAGSREELLGSTDADVDTFTISADGRILLFSGAFERRLQVLQTLDLETHRLASFDLAQSPSCPPFHPRLSPDGKALAFVCHWNQASHDLFVMPIDGRLRSRGQAKRLTSRGDRIGDIEWAPDSQSLFFVAGPLGSGSVFRVPADASHDPQVVHGIDSDVETIAVARKAWTLAVSNDYSDQNIWRHPLKSAAAPVPVIRQGKLDDEPVLSPDGTMLLYSSGPSGRAQIWVSDAGGRSPRRLTDFSSADSVSAIWSADGRHAVISVRSKELGERVYRCAAQGEPVLERMLDGATAVSVSRDGKWLYVTKRWQTSRSLWRVPWQSPGPWELVADGAAVGHESPDGKRFCFARRIEREGIWCFALPAGQPERVVEQVYRRNLFAVGRDGIYFVGSGGGTPGPALYFHPGFRAATPRKIAALGVGVAFGFTITPAEDWAFLTQEDDENFDISIMEGLR